MDNALQNESAQAHQCLCLQNPEGSPVTWKPTVASILSEICHNEAVNAEYMHLTVRSHGEALTAKPGQFFQLLCPQEGKDQPFFRRPMSLYGVNPHSGTVSFLYKIAGTGTRCLAALRPGDSLDIMGPLGKGFSLNPEWRHIVVVGRGAGLATLTPLAGAAKALGIQSTVIFSARNAGVLVSPESLSAECAERYSLLDTDGGSDPANVERIVRGLIAEGRCDALFTCGSSRIVLLLQRLAEEFEIPGQVAMEERMACGLGLCHCCVRRFTVDGQVVTRRICSEGPVFDMKEVLP